MGLTAPELCPAGPSRRSTFTRIQTRVAMHAMCLLPSCGADAEGLSATTFDAACATPASSNRKLQGQRQGLKPRHTQHDIQKRRRKGVVGPIGSATEINWSVATQFYGRICVRKMRDLLDPSNDSPFRRWSKTLW
jgi:hypothetical protein